METIRFTEKRRTTKWPAIFVTLFLIIGGCFVAYAIKFEDNPRMLGLSGEIITTETNGLEEVNQTDAEKLEQAMNLNYEIRDISSVDKSTSNFVSDIHLPTLYVDGKELADLNAKIEELNKQITDLKAEISEKDIQIADLKKEVATKQETINNLQSQLDTINSQLAQTNATAAQILKDYKAYSKGQLVTGTMANNGAVSKTLNAGQSYTIPAGYHNGSGKVTANSLASQTSATATAADIASGKTAWVNGNRITGTMSSITNSKVVYQNKVGNGAVTWTYTPNVTGNFLVVYSGGNGGSTKSNTSLTSITGYQSIQVFVNNYQGIDTSLTYPWSSWSYVAIVKMNANTTLKISAGGNAKTVSIIQLGS